MTEEVKYNNTLVSGRADETLSYTRYIKDESSGKSTKELLDEKVNKTDQLGTTQIADNAVTNEKLAEHSVDNSKLSPDSVSYEKIQDDAVTTEKIHDGAITTEKVEEKAVTNQKLGDQSVDGRVVREASLETKHFTNESVTTEKVARKSITKDKLADNSVDNSQVVDGSIGNAKLSPDSVTTEKIKDSSVTNEKVANDTLGIEKFDPELRKTIQAATGLPEDLSQMIQDVDKSVKQLHEKDTDLQSQINDKQQQITSNDEDISLLQTRSTQMEEAIKGISASGGASVASAVTYENTESGLDSVTAQGAIDELANKKFDKENIAQGFGESEDKVVSQFALPFREIESLEFLHCIVDAEDHFLFGIQLDGSIEWGKGIPAPIRAKLQDIINQCQQDKTDVLEAINAAKEELSASITTLQEGKVDKEEGKSLIEDEVKECFKVIENEEFIKVITDADDRVLFGIYRATGEPYYPLNEMYHVEQNEEFFALWLDAANHVLLGIRRDGQIIGEIHAVNALKQVISSLLEKVDTINASLQELLDIFSLQENPEYLAVEKDADGKILSATYNDGSHYSHNLKSETIPEEFEHIEDPEGRTEITTDAENKVMSYRDSSGKKHEHDMEVTNLDVSNLNLQGNSVNNIQDALKANGFDVKTPIDWSNADYVQISIPRCAKINLHTDIMPTAKSGMGISGKTCDIHCFMEFWDMQGNYFKIPILLSAQGNSSMGFVKKNLAIDLLLQDKSDAFIVKFGDWVSQDSFHLKAYYTDFFRGVGAVSYALYEQMVKTLSIDEDRPYKTLYTSKYKDYDYGTSDSESSLDRNFDTGAKCFPQGFPVIVYQNGEFYGVYSWQLKKHRDNMHMDKKNVKHIHLDGTIDGGTIFGGNINWTAFEVRNPKNLYMQESHNIQGKDTTKYNGDFPYELMGTDSALYNSGNKDQKNTTLVKQYIIDLSTRIGELNSAVAESKSDDEIKGLFEKYFDVSNLVDYILETNLIADGDGYSKNWQWTTYDGVKWFVNPYDHDGAFGAYHLGNYISSAKNFFYGNSKTTPIGWIYSYYKLELKNRWAELRKKGIFTTTNIIDLLTDWCSRIGYDNWKSEYKKWSESPCNRNSNINEEYWEYNPLYITTWSSTSTYNSTSVVKASDGKAYLSLTNSNVGINPVNDDGTNWKDVTYNADATYNIGDMVCYGKNTYYKFTCKKDCVNQPPLTKFYEKYPYELGHFDSIYRVQKWVENRISYMDKLLEYENN